MALLLAQTAFADLVRNGGFEQGTQDWDFLTRVANATGQLDSTEKHEGKTSFKISNKSAWAPNVYARIVQIVSGLRPFTTYTVSCWVKGKGCGLNWFGGGPGWYTRTTFPQGDFDWRQISFEVSTGNEADNYELMVVTESQTEALWIDDIRFELKTVDQAKQDAAYAQTDSTIAGFMRRLDNLKTNNNAYVRLGTAVAQRFIHFAQTGGPNGQMSGAWIKMQLDEVAQVLDETEKLARTNSPLFEWTPPKLGTVKYKNGTFYNNSQPYYFYGYGHFDSVIDDLSNFPALGASLIQDGRTGPSGMSADGVLDEGALTVVRGLDLAAQYGMRDDFLLSPHYYPAWAQAPDVPNGNIGFIKFNIFHPKARDAIGRFAVTMAEHIKDKPALHSVCLANEPVYSTSGRDKYTRPLFIDYLRKKHHTLARLNALYGTAYTNFNDAVVPPNAMPAQVGAQRAYYDWTSFNKKMFADWHAWLDSVLKTHGVKAPTHTKIMVFQTLDRDKLYFGVDPELICHATDLAGCDAYAFLGGSSGYAYDWTGHEFFYDLLHSFRGQSVFNSENHLIPDGSDRSHIPMNHTRSVLWQDGLHHQGSTTIWVWQMAVDQGLGGSIYFRPANIFGAGRAMLDLNRLAPEVTAINNARPRVALLDSQPSIFWEDKYKGTMFSLYTALNFMGEPITFVSERQLAAGTAAKVDWLIVPNATHVLDSTLRGLAAYKKSGGKILLVGTNCLGRDEYDRPRLNLPAYPPMQPGADDRATAALLRTALHPLQTADLRESPNDQPAWGIEFRIVPMGKTTLVPLNNFNKEAKTVTLPKWAGQQALDLLSGETVDLNAIALEPMLPRLLRIGP
jgi:hypothetical protein